MKLEFVPPSRLQNCSEEFFFDVNELLLDVSFLGRYILLNVLWKPSISTMPLVELYGHAHTSDSNTI